MRFFLKILLSAVAVLILSKVLPGVQVDSYTIAILVAIVLAFLNTFVRPILVFFTFPVTLITLGLFLLVINAAIILIAGYFVDGFQVNGWWYALIFSVTLSLFQSLLHGIIKKDT